MQGFLPCFLASFFDSQPNLSSALECAEYHRFVVYKSATKVAVMTANIGLIAFDSSGRQLVIGSTFKGVIAGVCIGWFAKKVHSLPLGILFGLGVGMFLAYLIAAIPQPSGKHYYFAIMLPGSLVGAIVGYATQKHQSSREPTAVRT